MTVHSHIGYDGPHGMDADPLTLTDQKYFNKVKRIGKEYLDGK
jgi:hypothetical protein